MQGGLEKCSIFREEAVEAMAEALDCHLGNEKVQEKAARALTLLAGRFTSRGEAFAEQWLLQQSGFHQYPGDTFGSKDLVFDNSTYLVSGFALFRATSLQNQLGLHQLFHANA